ncbi:MAG: hypothetical protein ACXQTS_06705 [Candidatus Methanospirareceae archaeon]
MSKRNFHPIPKIEIIKGASGEIEYKAVIGSDYPIEVFGAPKEIAFYIKHETRWICLGSFQYRSLHLYDKEWLRERIQDVLLRWKENEKFWEVCRDTILRLYFDTFDYFGIEYEKILCKPAETSKT